MPLGGATESLPTAAVDSVGRTAKPTVGPRCPQFTTRGTVRATEGPTCATTGHVTAVSRAFMGAIAAARTMAKAARAANAGLVLLLLPVLVLVLVLLVLFLVLLFLVVIIDLLANHLAHLCENCPSRNTRKVAVVRPSRLVGREACRSTECECLQRMPAVMFFVLVRVLALPRVVLVRTVVGHEIDRQQKPM